ncbi:MAG TPA: carboxylating nicotinate-nucleotide diphosphorylase [Gemmatimonadales bacterium]|nr:carboxylating nicotinate-nucleotide diphosphorylase [Gemmatimonadales bacterium]
MADPAADAERLAEVALAEDGARDLTTEVTAAADERLVGRIELRTPAVVAGLAYAEAVAARAGCGPIAWRVVEGERCDARTVLGTFAGSALAVLRAERPLLNLLQRASGIATATRAYVDAVAGTGCRVLHTRKTAPGLRALDVRAVLAGGGALHRVDLADTVMIKDNHWQALARAGRPLADAVAEARRRGARAVQVEVEHPAQLREACGAGADRLLVDNQSAATLRAWAAEARRLRPGIEIEATGGITLENVRAYAEAGADYVSIGALTHSVRAADVAVEVAAG